MAGGAGKPGRLDVRIYDDCSSSPDAVRYLKGEEIETGRAQFLDSESRWLKPLLKAGVPDFRKIRLPAGIPVETSEKNLGDAAGLFHTIDRLFQARPDAEFGIVSEDDLLYSDGWLDKALKLWEELKDVPGFAAAGLYRGGIQPVGGRWLKSVTVFGPCLLIPAKFYRKMKQSGLLDKRLVPPPPGADKFQLGIFNNYNIFGDIRICQFAKNSKMDMYLSAESLAQHIGIKSTMNPEQGIRHAPTFCNKVKFQTAEPDAR